MAWAYRKSRWLAAAAAAGLAAAMAAPGGVSPAAGLALVAPGPGSARPGDVRPGDVREGDVRPAGAPTVPCPTVPLPEVRRPPRPVPPPLTDRERSVGGAALATRGLVVPPGAPAPPALTATSWLVADLDSGEVLGGCGPHEHGTPASVQKLLLAATVLPNLDPARVVTVTREDLNFEPGSSAVGLVLGGRYSVAMLWLGLLLNSGNDAANVLARVGGGGEGVAGTIRAMNERARELGAYQTTAVTPSGLDGPGQFTSAYDLALIARACFAEPDFRRYVTTKRTRVPPQPAARAAGFEIQNENRLVFNYPGALGGKTGYTDLARHSYVGAAQRGDRRLVVTLLGAEARPLRGWQQGAALLDWGFALPPGATVGRLVEPGELASPTPPTRLAAPSQSSVVAAPPVGPVQAEQGRSGEPVWAGRSRALALSLALVLVALLLAVVALVLAVAARRSRR